MSSQQIDNTNNIHNNDSNDNTNINEKTNKESNSVNNNIPSNAEQPTTTTTRKRIAIPSANKVFKKSDISIVELNAKLKKDEDELKATITTANTTAATITTTTTTSISPSLPQRTSPIQPNRFIFKTPSPNKPVNNSNSHTTSPTTTTTTSSSQVPYYSPSFVKNPTAPPPPINSISPSLPKRPQSTIIAPSLPIRPSMPINPNSNITTSFSTKYDNSKIIYANIMQRGNPLMKYIGQGIKIEYSEIQYPDYVLNPSTCVFFISLKVHRDRPSYIVDHIKNMSVTTSSSIGGGSEFTLRILLVLADLNDSENGDTYLDELNLISIKLQCTLIVCWSSLEGAKYLEGYKVFFNRQPDSIKTRTIPIEQGGKSKNEEVLTSIKALNKTDATTLVKNFKNMKQIFTCSKDTLSKCPGFGPVKVQNFYNTIHQPFKNNKSSNKTTTTTATTTTTTTTTTNTTTNNNYSTINNININNENNQDDDDPLNFSFDFGGGGSDDGDPVIDNE